MGPKIEHDRHFPNRVNAEFVSVLSPGEVRMRVWERGAGETLACRTAPRGRLRGGSAFGTNGARDRRPPAGGALRLHWAEDNHVYMTGPAVEVFSGDWPDNM